MYTSPWLIYYIYIKITGKWIFLWKKPWCCEIATSSRCVLFDSDFSFSYRCFREELQFLRRNWHFPLDKYTCWWWFRCELWETWPSALRSSFCVNCCAMGGQNLNRAHPDRCWNLTPDLITNDRWLKMVLWFCVKSQMLLCAEPLGGTRILNRETIMSNHHQAWHIQAGRTRYFSVCFFFLFLLRYWLNILFFSQFCECNIFQGQ